MPLTNLRTLTDYLPEFLRVIRIMEDHRELPYYDPAREHYATIGDGINIDYTNINHLKLGMNENGLIAAADAQTAQSRQAA